MSKTAAPPTARWTLRRVDPDVVAGLMRGQNLSRVGATLLAARGFVEEKAAFAHLEPRLTALHDPALFADMPAATGRLARAIRGGERILVHGDYDVDGVTGTVLLMRLLEQLGARADWHIPNRFTDGYAFGPHSLARAAQTGATLVVSVDNGTSSHATIAALRARGVDTIVTDHHEPSEGALPDAVAIVNPKLPRARYPFRELCGGAVAFKLAWGLCQELSGTSKVRADLRDYLVEAMGYVAIATVCDVVPLVDENRVLAHHGLRSLAAARRPGIAALLEVAELGARTLSSEDVAFKIGPRIEGELVREAVAAAERFADRDEHPVIVVAGEGWHQGVVGIVAARLVARFERPAVVIGLEGATGRGSARSVPGFDVLEALRGAREHLEHFGGHMQAAGLSVRAERIERVRAAVCERAREMLGGRPLAAPGLAVDLVLDLEHMTHDLMREIDRLQPFGERNEKPVIVSQDLRLASPPKALGGDGSHLRLELRSGATVLKGMAFGQARRMGELALGKPIHAAWTPKWNTFRGETNLELEIVDFQTGPAPHLA